MSSWTWDEIRAAIPSGAPAESSLELLQQGDVDRILASPEALRLVARPGVDAGAVEAALLSIPHTARSSIRRAARSTPPPGTLGTRTPVPRELPPLVVHGPTWRVHERGRYLPVQRELVVTELLRLHPDLDLTRTTPDGGTRLCSAPEAYERYGVTAREVEWHYGGLDAEPSAWDPESRTLSILAARPCVGPARRSAVVAEWLDELTDRPAVLLDWLATAHLLDQPTAVLQLRGPPGAGKGLLTQGLTTWLGGSCAYDQAVGERTSAVLIHGPLVVLDEGAIDPRPDALRRLIGSAKHAVEAKFRAPEHLIGCPRILVTANQADPLRLSRADLDHDSQQALGLRILSLRCRPEAAVYLERLGGWQGLSGWLGPDGELVCHLRWLAAERRVERGSRRWLVTGDGADWVSEIRRQSDLARQLREHYAAYLDLDPGGRSRVAGEPYGWAPGDPSVEVSVQGLLQSWTAVTGAQRAPSPRQLGEVLGALGEGPVRPRSGARRRVYRVPTETLEGE